MDTTDIIIIFIKDSYMNMAASPEDEGRGEAWELGRDGADDLLVFVAARADDAAAIPNAEDSVRMKMSEMDFLVVPPLNGTVINTAPTS
jgi:hypothetical protein